MNAYQQAAEKTRDWLDAHFTADGTFVLAPEDSRAYYKTPYLLATAGLPGKGARVAKRALERFIDEQGNLLGPANFALEQRVYGMGWLALGGTAVGRFDLAEVVSGRLVEMQDQCSGGMVLPDEDIGEDVAEVCFSAGAGMGMAAAGKLQAARLMADRFIALLDAQPEPGRFYNRFRPDGSIVAQAAEGAWSKMYDLELDEQRPANFATVVLALVWTGRATGEKRYFEAAARYVAFVHEHQLDPARFGRSTKFGWAMLQLYEDTGDESLVAHASRLGDVLISYQCDDGLWDPRPATQVAIAPAERLTYSSDCAMTVFALANQL